MSQQHFADLQNRRAGFPSSQVIISILIPCYNGLRYIPRLTESLEPIVCDAIEVIFIDDGSTDHSFELFREAFPKAISIKRKNRGLGATRNEAAEIARGDFLQLLDVDDTIAPDKLVTQWKHAKATNSDVVYSDWRMVIVQEENMIFESWVRAETQTEIVEALLAGWWFPPNAALIRRSAYLEVGGCDPSLRDTCEDFDLWVRLAIAGFQYSYIPGQFANYYRYDQVRSMSRRNQRAFCEGVERILKRAINLLTVKNQLTRARACAAAQRLYSTARNVYRLDREWYESLLSEVYDWCPGFSPKGSPLYRAFAKSLGPRNAERFAELYRWVRPRLSK